MKPNLRTLFKLIDKLPTTEKTVEMKKVRRELERQFRNRLNTLEHMQKTIPDGMSKERLILIMNIKELLEEA